MFENLWVLGTHANEATVICGHIDLSELNLGCKIDDINFATPHNSGAAPCALFLGNLCIASILKQAKD